jgi:pyrroloquinoline quinone biosynthesis protein E
MDRPLADIWYHGAAFNAYRGDHWMPDLCRTCERKEIDFGGCRCQAMALAGDASATDPVCIRSPLRQTLVEQAEIDSRAEPPPFVYRSMRPARADG